ncbi:tetratricopeptide repeat protein [Candidatus Gracilibacteria bacterium]|nr:tetratricopeptide repeat protein [Candidatus Gracilibacteria bacterium]
MINKTPQADALIQQGKAALQSGDLPKATELLNQAVRLYWAAGEFYKAAAETGNYGWTLRRQGRPDLARTYLLGAADLFDRVNLAEFAARHRAAAQEDEILLTPELLAQLPPAVRGALERGDLAGLQFALDALPAAEQSLVYEQLAAAGVVSDPVAADSNAAIKQFEPLLHAIADVARGSYEDRADIEQALDDLERKGWRLRKVVHKIWQGQRNAQALTYGLDELDAQLIRRVLEILAATP